MGSDFPAIFAPEKGYVASANNRPPAHDVPVGFFFSPDDRVQRIGELLEGAERVDSEMLKALQQDIAMPSASALRSQIAALLEGQAEETLPIARALADWDGRHDTASRGALAFELMVHHLLHCLHAEDELWLYLATWDLTALLKRDLRSLPEERLKPSAAEAARAAQSDFAEHASWGAVHRLRLEHPFARAPFIGKRYRFLDEGVGGGNETLMKTAHGVARDVHRVAVGAVARHVSDLSDPDANDFCLLGGQDGWLGSDNFCDQYELWRKGDYIRMPMTQAAVESAFPHVVELRPVLPAAQQAYPENTYV